MRSTIVDCRLSGKMTENMNLIGFELALYWVCFGIVLALIGFELGLNWVCFCGAGEAIGFHNRLF